MVERPLAVVTGASSGIGRALAARLAVAGYDLILVSRDAGRLADAGREAEALGAGVTLVSEDLSHPLAGTRAASWAGGRTVDVLVNNAGFGLHGAYSQTDAGLEHAMVQTHIVALLDITKTLLPGMLERMRGRIVNIGSVYSYAPVPHQAVYGATKAFLLSFSESLNGELEGTGVTVTTVLPGITRTEFRSRAGIAAERLTGMSAEAVAEAAYRGMMAGRRIVVPGLCNKLLVGLARAVPAVVFSAIMRAINRFRGLSPAP